MRACWQCGRRSCTPEAETLGWPTWGEADLGEGQLEEGELEGEAEGEASGEAAETHAEAGGGVVSSQRGAARRCPAVRQCGLCASAFCASCAPEQAVEI